MSLVLAMRCFFTALGSGAEKVRLQRAIDGIKDPPVIKEIVREVMVPQRGAPPPREIIKEVPVEVIKEVPVEVVREVIKEVPVEVIKEVQVEVIKEIPVEVIREVIKEVPVEVIREIIKEVPVEVIKEIIKEVPVEVIREVIKEVPVEIIKEVIKEVPIEIIKEIIREVPVEVIKEVIIEVPFEVIREVPVEVIKEVIREVPVEARREPAREIIRETIVQVPVETVREIVKRIPDTHGPAQLLALLQQDGRLIDFLYENIDLYDDERVGAVARAIHDKCRKTLFKYIALEPIRAEKEGEMVTLGSDYDASSIRVTGAGSAQVAMFGTLKHRGWRAAKIELPPSLNGADPTIVMPAEVEVE